METTITKEQSMRQVESQVESLMKFINDGEMRTALNDPFKGPYYVVGYLLSGITTTANLVAQAVR